MIERTRKMKIDDGDDNDGQVDREEPKFECGFHMLKLTYQTIYWTTC